MKKYQKEKEKKIQIERKARRGIIKKRENLKSIKRSRDKREKLQKNEGK